MTLIDKRWRNLGRAILLVRNIRNNKIKQLKLYHYVKESDTIEDLCDEFVGIDDWNRHHKIENPNNIEIVKNFLKTFKEKYGAIWNDKGLRYVAKMNENGELELI